ncbi:YybH family protein [Nafulsella turpanensis]|uniref:YybH family protein n=1 Tax=Nafulsella turpanensis TaxID=1265690 RepID=UPI00034AAE66|nr:nuclear transport factor 2 family protein [Nafulsella turpanensis]
MKRFFFTFLLFLFFMEGAHAQKSPKEQIAAVLEQQTQAWNSGRLEDFMKGYWRSDSLMFIGKSGLTYGWDQTLQNYRRNYSDRQKMGKLRFDVINIQPVVEQEAYFVVGKWHLKRDAAVGDLEGYFSLLWKKKDGNWVIVADHSS